MSDKVKTIDEILSDFADGHAAGEAWVDAKSELERIMLQGQLNELDKLIDINDQTFNRWTQRDIAHFFDVVGKRYRELEAKLTKVNEEKRS